MQRFARILLVYDGTPEAQSALARCVQLARGLSALVDVVSIVDAVGANALAAGMLLGEGFAHLELLANAAVNTATTQLKHAGVTAHGHVAFGSPVDVVSKHAELFRSDIVMIGHRVRGPFARWLGDQTVHANLADRLRGSTIVTVT
jgi:nucleotide-binding universal stress UspA family protein